MGAPTAGWENFFVAEVGAAAALSGLLFVAVSISLSRIVASRHLPDRAAETLVTFLSVLVVATLGLVPGQSGVALGYEIGGAGLLAWIAATRRQVRAYRDPDLEEPARRWLWVRVLGTQAGSVPFVVAGVLLVRGSENALLWVAPGTIASFVSGAFNAWVLLVEIQR
ncbi:MAG TPA: hypothetical protein VK762_28610 [Polyangiaceae bacterium]|jgi:hypothetical protein|nr:hypothetical protein [Polyangiaceae bacterium]